MKKVDEIMELLADEMQDFKKGLLEMKKMTNELQTRSIPISTEVMEKHLNFFFQKQQIREKSILENLNAIDQKLKDAHILPKNVLLLLGSILLVLVLITAYLGFEVMQSEEEKIEILREGSAPLCQHQP